MPILFSSFSILPSGLPKNRSRGGDSALFPSMEFLRGGGGGNGACCGDGAENLDPFMTFAIRFTTPGAELVSAVPESVVVSACFRVRGEKKPSAAFLVDEERFELLLCFRRGVTTTIF